MARTLAGGTLAGGISSYRIGSSTNGKGSVHANQDGSASVLMAGGGRRD